ncbi:MAG TPA: hypothetical protein EYQ68_07905 [Cytophagales bacterium]|jgi:hypothetical protein|nr:hypothetical protein [Cytophagales bacterium]
MDSKNNNWKSIFLFSTIFFVLGYLVGNSFKGHKPMGGVFLSDDIKGMDHMGNILKGDGKNEHFIIKEFKGEDGTIDIDITSSSTAFDSEMDIDKIIKEAEGDPNMAITIDSSFSNGKKMIKVKVRKGLLHEEHNKLKN